MKYIVEISGVLLIFILNLSCKKETAFVIKQDLVEDIDSNVYTSVSFGTQIWMAENLKTTRYSNGDLIGTTTPATLDISGEATPKYQWAFNGDESNVSTYGRLYTWYAVTDSRNVCPTGWHVPTDTEWTTLINFMGGDSAAGGKLKERGTIHWESPNVGAIWDSGFKALPGGSRGDGFFLLLGYNGLWWSSSEESPVGAWYRNMGYESSIAHRSFSTKSGGFSVRCLKDN